MSFKSIVYLILMGLILTGCSTKPQPIEYGKDQCIFCKMNVVDKAHSAQLVTTKGKQYKYDAIECLINDYDKREDADIAIMLVANFNNPGEMLEAQKATYLISPGIKSPMGAFLSAVDDSAIAKSLVEKNGGDVYDWKAVVSVINKYE